MKYHKAHARKRETVCGLKYCDRKDMVDFVFNRLKGHWRLVTCNKCHIAKYKYLQMLKKGGDK